MIKTIPVEKLRVGMYVIISKAWFQHPFVKSEFIIKSHEQIRKFRASGFKEISIDTEKSLVAVDTEPSGPQREPRERRGPPIPEIFDPMKLIADDLIEAINDEQLEPREKARAVYSHSIDMMNNLLEQPTAQNIYKSKSIIRTFVDYVLVDNETSSYLLKVAARDFYTYTHSVNVGILSVLIAKELFDGRESHDMRELGAGFFLHDLGKCNVPNNLIYKEGKLTDEERRWMRLHPAHGRIILEKAKQLSQECGYIVSQHHEREDGTGYPHGLKGDEIHLYGRICRIADVYDALTSKRPYKVEAELPPFKALQIMKDEMVTPFNWEVFKVFVSLFAGD